MNRHYTEYKVGNKNAYQCKYCTKTAWKERDILSHAASAHPIILSRQKPVDNATLERAHRTRSFLSGSSRQEAGPSRAEPSTAAQTSAVQPQRPSSPSVLSVTQGISQEINNTILYSSTFPFIKNDERSTSKAFAEMRKKVILTTWNLILNNGLMQLLKNH